MRIVIIEDEKSTLDQTVQAVKESVIKAEIKPFSNPFQALTYLEKESADVTLIDVEMKMMDGLALSDYLQKHSPQMNLIFVASHSRFVREAMQMHVSGYILKPVTPDKVQFELKNLRHVAKVNSKEGFRVQTFGNFEVFYNDEPVRFHYSKTKEMLAYLIDRRGSMCTNEELQKILWGNVSPADCLSYFKRIRKDLLDTLERYEMQKILIRGRGVIGVVPDRIECDFYDWINGTVKDSGFYNGEYMAQYEWAERTHGWIETSVHS